MRVILIFLAVFIASPLYADRAKRQWFEKNIRPLLAANCYECHSHESNKLKANLFLDSKQGWNLGGDSGPALVPGDPESSLLIKAVRYHDEDLKMPPKGRLSPEQVALLERWIRDGAYDPRSSHLLTKIKGKTIDIEKGKTFWSFRPMVQAPLPEVKDRAWPRGMIDTFLLAAMEAKGVRPVGPTDRRSLLYRAYFDLTGLPPTEQDIAAFLADTSREAFAKVVDRLLSSKHFGERWGRHWLDVARYAESTGGGRTMLFPDAWRYRDYVIDAFNADKPYDRFVTEQLAGDLMPHETPQERWQQLVAIGFLALGPTNYEQQDKEHLRMDVVDEQLDVLGRAFMGMTLGCARCHDHKFDPIPAADYYAMAGIFRSTQSLVNANVSSWIKTSLPLDKDDPKQRQRAEHQAAVKALEAKVSALKKRIDPKGAKGQVAGGPADPAKLPGIVLDDTKADIQGIWMHSTSQARWVQDGYLHDENTRKGESWVTWTPDIPEAGRYEVRVSYSASTNRDRNVPVIIQHADGRSTEHVDQARAPLGGQSLRAGGRVFDSKRGARAGCAFPTRARSSGSSSTRCSSSRKRPWRRRPRRPGPGRKNPRKRRQAKTARSCRPNSKRSRHSSRSSREKKPPPVPIAMGVKDFSAKEDCRINIRGNPHNLGEEVPRGFLQVASLGTPPEIAKDQSGRLELAQWLTAPEHPLTARVMVNRIWYYLYGKGLVRQRGQFRRHG